MIGQTITRYKVLSKLGEGGMGEVYKAEDTSLKRPVALKFLVLQSLGGVEDQERFQREAEAAAALSHPHIATVYEFSEFEGKKFIAMEYLEGGSLKEKIQTGPLKLRDAIQIGVQISEGLHAAHEKGIVHRDIKSANIMLTGEGKVKITDFGLAKLSHRSRVTQQGMTMGTADYMSPEQAQGEPADHRTDLWSVGVVLYEMITGQLPFKADFAQALTYRIMSEDPEPLTAIRTGVPMALERIVFKLLAKDPASRYQHADELAVDLKGVELPSSGPSRITQAPTVVERESRGASSGRLLPWAVAAVATVVAAVSFLLGGSTEPPPLRRWTIMLPDSAPLDPVRSGNLGVGQPALVLSPDQETLVYVAGVGRNGMLYKRPLNGLEAVPIEGTEGASNPFFSPDGQWIAFFAGRELKKVPIHGGLPQLICEATNAYGGCWSTDGDIFLSYKEGTVLGRVSSSGGKPTILASSKGRIREFRWPHLLPGEKYLLASGGSVNAVSLETGETSVVQPDALFPRYLPGGWLLYTRGGAVEVVPFDVENLTVTGKPIQAIIGIRIETRGPAQYVCTDDGTLIYAPGLSETRTELVTLDREGRESPLPFPPDNYGTFKYSPDGERVAAAIERTSWSVYVLDLVRSSRTNLTPGGGNHSFPIWSPDGVWITFNSELDNVWNIYRKRADGWGETERLTDSERNEYPHAWSPDGQRLLFQEAAETGVDLFVVSPVGETAPEIFEKTESSEWGPSFSPNGRWVAYTSDEEGQYEIYVTPFPQTGQRWRISTEGGEEPIWSPTRDELYYRFGREWMVVEYDASPDFTPGPPRLLFDGDYVNVSGFSYDVSPDGERFLLLRRHGKAEKLTRLNVVTNWFGELDRLAQQ